ncbi:hypothetical protein E9993_03175 [Labilibacter sediminis]|nr:hypothetical protein E9993_03175 [Labilibacter sediminis]
MKQFPEIDKFDDDELIIIVCRERKYWQQDAIIYAEKRLRKNGITAEYAKRRLIELEKQEEQLWEKEIKDRKTTGYDLLELIFMTISWPKHILYDWYLEKEGYLKKKKQRRFTIGAGILLYCIFILHADLSYDKKEQNRIEEINNFAVQDSIAISKVNWSGLYSFVDSSTLNKNKVIWQLELNKKNGKHKGILKLNNDEVKCTGILHNNLIEFYPDTTFTFIDGRKISYYDKLFSFDRDSLNTYTLWGKLGPIYHKKKNIHEHFIKKQL